MALEENNGRRGRGSSAAFTLVEMLVVIAIIGLLVALLLPVLSKAKDTATIVTCESVERQNMIALTTYTDDNKNRIPPTNMLAGASNDSISTWYPFATGTILAANTNRFALGGGPYGNRMGFGHVLAGGYFGEPYNIKGCFEPTYFWPGSNLVGNHGQAVEYYAGLWRANANSTLTAAPSATWVINGYEYRGWLGDVDNWPVYSSWLLDKRRSPSIDRMFDRAAIWCSLVSWNSQIKVTLCHRTGYNVAYFDGHAKFISDPDALVTYNYAPAYWEMNSYMVRDLFDPSIDPPSVP
jgi:prepilin-type N-terminal cleavage/methylation domain-containing protein/prepilin-type processing-associated H-X9-DG protein